MDPNGSINPIGGFPRRRGPAVVVVLFLLPTLAAGAACFTSIFSFGDSIADTGNQCILLPADPPCTLPFGRTFFHRSTGRNGDGRLMIEKSAIANNAACSSLLNNSLVLLGEIGGNDYNFAFSSGISLNKIQELVPMVINTIGLALKEVIKFGATNILVPGNFPVGCVPRILSRFRSSNPRDYDPSTGCLAQYNQFAQLHNEQLQMELNDTRRLYPHVNIIYVDYYNALMPVYLSPKKFGFTGGVLEPCCRFTGGVLKPCCNGGMNRSTICCDEPSTYVNWDGIHFTEATYRLIVKGIMKDGSLTNPNLNASSCLVGDP
ncbi:unnamed protein product [Linum tenue]|uniref:GDSL esterase/lipase n=1 Tax=Linum tenue TaxID=586396 RepID=A0AAV0GSC5_9ROSI|nr:unnamed protein product [Linum tenue]